MKTRRTMLSGVTWLAGLAITGLSALAKSTQPNSEPSGQNNSLDELKDSFSKFRQEYTKLSETVSALSKDIAPVGTILAFAGPIDSPQSLPPNFMKCDGTAMKREEFEALWNAIKDTYGAGKLQRGVPVTGCDFNLPDLRGYFLRGVDDGAQLDPDSGRGIGKPQLADMERHNHGVDGVYLTKYSISPPGAMPEGGLRYGDPGGGGYSQGAKPLPTTSYPSQTDKGKETRPLNYAVYWIIRVC
jgi:rhizosphere induced protein